MDIAGDADGRQGTYSQVFIARLAQSKISFSSLLILKGRGPSQDKSNLFSTSLYLVHCRQEFGKERVFIC